VREILLHPIPHILGQVAVEDRLTGSFGGLGTGFQKTGNLGTVVPRLGVEPSGGVLDVLPLRTILFQLLCVATGEGEDVGGGGSLFAGGGVVILLTTLPFFFCVERQTRLEVLVGKNSNLWGRRRTTFIHLLGNPLA
jgi:hypothetical protein